MTDHLPECIRWFNDMPAVDECPACEMFRACEQRVLDKVIKHAELTFRSDIINPVRDVIEPLLDRNDSSDSGTKVPDAPVREAQQVQWDRDFREAETRGECIHSGLRIVACKQTICDCFDYEEKYGRSKR